MLGKVLIANRGEIACRIIKTLDRLGIESVAVYHHQDRRAPHVAMAGEAILIEGATPAGAYLDQEQIIEVCRASGASAVHPGYGFLSENASFAERLAAAGLVFIGPDASTIRLMGDKIRSRDFAAANGVPVAPSATQDDADDDFLAKAAALGFPLLVKASAGGGGKGMKVVRSAAELEGQVALAMGEATRYFGDPRVFAEKLVEKPRHIEVQILGDGEGRVVHLFERECSLQRRYQKIVEESPAPNLSEDLRQRICAAAVRLTSAACYRNAGTVEFILGADGAFHFLEMNTRLQVEHPVTETVLGIDLVAEQIVIAAGKGLSFAQSDLRPRGHAIECRICAEEPERDFRPAVGRIGVLRVPATASIRFDGGIQPGQAITPAFDSLLGKLIVHADSREEAATALAAALDDLVLLGVRTNIDYLARLMRLPAFLSGALDTGFLAAHAGKLAGSEGDDRANAAAVIAAALGASEFRAIALDVPEPYASMGAWRN